MTNVGGNVGGNVGDNVGDKDDTKLTERQEAILNLIKENAHASASEMSEVLSVTQRTIERDLAAMQKKRAIIREGNVKSGRWVVIKE
jgi:ATP-dependent DNA helicase RecG